VLDGNSETCTVQIGREKKKNAITSTAITATANDCNKNSTMGEIHQKLTTENRTFYDYVFEPDILQIPLAAMHRAEHSRVALQIREVMFVFDVDDRYVSNGNVGFVGEGVP
jgi:hypothetical protein